MAHHDSTPQSILTAPKRRVTVIWNKGTLVRYGRYYALGMRRRQARELARRNGAALASLNRDFVAPDPK
jgi:hypothetical protein